MISLTKNQLSSLAVSLILIRLFLTLPREMLNAAGNSAWLLVIYLTAITLVLFGVVLKTYKRNESILEIAEDIGGRGLKIITGLISAVLILAKTAGHIKLFIESVQIVLLQNTKIELIVICLAIALIIGAYQGIESLAIISGLFLPVVLTVLASFVVLLIPSFDLKSLTPIFGTGIKSIFVDGLKTLSVFGDLFLLTFLLPYCKDDNSFKKSSIKAILIGGGIFFAFLLTYGAIFPYPISAEYIIPIFQLTRIVSIGDFFGRLEAFFEFVWAISFFIYGAVNIWILSIIWQKTFDLKYSTPIIAPMTVFTVAAGLLQPNMLSSITGNDFFSWIIIAFTFFVPLVFGFLSKIRHKE